MKALYQKAYRRLLARVFGSHQDTAKHEVPTTLTNYSHDILHRMPKEDFKLAIKIPCLVKEYICANPVPRQKSKLSRVSRESEHMHTLRKERCVLNASIV